MKSNLVQPRAFIAGVAFVFLAAACLVLCSSIANSRVDVGVDIVGETGRKLRVGIVNEEGEVSTLNVMQAVPAGLSVPPAGQTRFHAFLSRKHLGRAVIAFQDSAMPEVVRVHVGTLTPTLLYAAEPPSERPPGKVGSFTPDETRNLVLLPPLSLFERGGVATFGLLLFMLFAAVFLAFWVIRLCLRPIQETGAYNAIEPTSGPRRLVRTPSFAGFFFPLLILWIFFLLVFYPGSIPGDPATQWRMPRGSRYLEMHSMLHTLLMWWISHVWDSAAAVVVVQCVALAFVISYAFAFLLSAGVKRRWVVLGYMVVVFWPVFWVYAITIYKGVSYAIVTLAATICLTRLVLDKHAREGYMQWVILGILVALIPLFRANGILVFWGMIPLTLLFFWKQWRRVLLTVAVMLLVFGSMELFLFPRYDPIEFIPSQRTRALQMAVGSLIAQDVPLTPKEYRLLNRIRPLEGNWGYRKTNSGEYRLRLDKNYLRANHDKFMEVFESLVPRYPLLLVKSRVAASGYLFYPFAPQGEQSIAFYSTSIRTHYGEEVHSYSLYVHRYYADDHDESSFFPGLEQGISDALLRTTERDWDWLFWRPALSLFILISAMIALCVRMRDFHFALPAFPALLTVLSVILSAPAQHVRYVLCLYFVIVFLVPLAFLPKQVDDKQPRNPRKVVPILTAFKHRPRIFPPF